MRQAGMMAAACLHALENHVDRLAEDHDNARRFASIVSQCEGLRLDPEPETNLVFINTSGTGLPAQELSARLQEASISLSVSRETRLRACTHLDVTREQVEEAAHTLVSIVESRR